MARDACEEKGARNGQEVGSELRLRRITSMTCRKTENEKTWAEHSNMEETGHQFELRIFFIITCMRPSLSPLCLKCCSFLLLVQSVWAACN